MRLPDGISGDDIKSALRYERFRRARTSLHSFIRWGWLHAGLPGTFVDGWHIRTLCARLAAINRSGWGRQMWASPPRSSKSTVIDVFWPAWTWLQEEADGALMGPWVQFLHVTHRDDLATRDSQRCRRLLKSDWYQELCQGKVRILPDADQSAYYALEGGGSRRAFGIRAAITGHDSDIQVVGDPIDVEAALSAVEREHVYFVWQEVLPSRFNHPTRNAQVLSAQRTHVADLHALVLESEDYQRGLWTYDCVPGVLDGETPYGCADDPRTVGDGKTYWPERFPTVESLMALAKTQHARAAQIQQNPKQRGAGIFRNANWQFVSVEPVGLQWNRWWDKAATPEGGGSDPDSTAGARGARLPDGRFLLADMQHGRWSSHQVEQRIKMVASQIDPPGTQIWIEEEPGSSGKDVTSYYQRHILRGFAVRGDRPTGPKLVRIDPFLAACEAGNVVLLKADWNRAFIDECDAFTGDDTTHDDQVISAAGCFKRAMAGVLGPLVW